MSRASIRPAILLVVAACGGTTDPAGALVSRLALDRTVLTPGDTVHIAVTIANVAPHGVTVRGSPCMVGVRVTDAQGRLADLFPGACPDIEVSVSFAPGETRTFRFRWTGERATVADGRFVRQPLPAGRYHVTGGFWEAAPGARRSPPVALQLLAPATAP